VEQSADYRTTTDTEKGTWNGKPDSMDDIDQGETYWKVAITEIEAGHIKLSTCYGDLDDIVNGTYGKVLTTDISSGHINLTSSFRIGGQTQATVGVYIEATNGITIKGGKLRLQDSAGGHTGSLYIDTDGILRLDAWGYTKTKSILPLGDITYNLGSSSLKWTLLYVHDVRLSGGVYPITSGAGHLGSTSYLFEDVVALQLVASRRGSAPANIATCAQFYSLTEESGKVYVKTADGVAHEIAFA